MAHNENEFPWTLEEQNGLLEALPTLLAGIAGIIDELHVHGLSVQRTDYGDYRSVLRGSWRTDAGYGPRLVAFTNAQTPSECFLRLEDALKSGTLRWHPDRYARDASEDVAAKGTQPGLTFAPNAKV